jgi:hypothetical protein
MGSCARKLSTDSPGVGLGSARGSMASASIGPFHEPGAKWFPPPSKKGYRPQKSRSPGGVS